MQDSAQSLQLDVFRSTVPGWGSVGFRGMRISELLWSAITCRGLHVDTLDRLPTTTLKEEHKACSSPVLPHRSAVDVLDSNLNCTTHSLVYSRDFQSDTLGPHKDSE